MHLKMSWSSLLLKVKRISLITKKNNYAVTTHSVNNTVQKKQFFYVAQGFFADLDYILAAKFRFVFSFFLSI